jgi:hypothetical protein
MDDFDAQVLKWLAAQPKNLAASLQSLAVTIIDRPGGVCEKAFVGGRSV